jgi:ATP-binding cassette subfamily B protein
VLLESPAPATLGASGPRLEVDDVHFAYPLRPEVEVLHGVRFVVEPGEMVALVGPSGAGKSTVFDLLQRFHDPLSGSIRLGGHDLRNLRLEEVRRVMGYVPQEAVLFAGSLGDNVRYGVSDASDEAVWEALRLASADGFVRALPQGLDTLLGESGVGLSGGQKQRLSIARALLKSPRILLLDEATSALDADSERAIRDSINRLKGRCSILVIAHRLSTVRQADRILVIEGGRIAGAGTHAELLRSSELYARFSGIQFADGVEPTVSSAADDGALPVVEVSAGA